MSVRLSVSKLKDGSALRDTRGELARREDAERGCRRLRQRIEKLIGRTSKHLRAHAPKGRELDFARAYLGFHVVD